MYFYVEGWISLPCFDTKTDRLEPGSFLFREQGPGFSDPETAWEFARVCQAAMGGAWHVISEGEPTA